MKDELIDILTKDGKPAGEVRMKSEAHRLGLFHASVHIWLYTKKGELLLQKRAADKDSYPNLWDISVAGHIGAGETPEDAALREIKEEIGLTIDSEDLQFLKIQLQQKQPKPGFFDNEFHHIYLVEFKQATKDLTLQKEEVADIKLIALETLKTHLEDQSLLQEYVPHSKEYYRFILKEITNRLK